MERTSWPPASWPGGWWLLLPLGFLMPIVPVLDRVTDWQDAQIFEEGAFSGREAGVLA